MTDTSAYPGINVDSILAASNAAPGLDPQSAYGIGQTSNDPSVAAENAQGAQAFGDAQTYANTLKQHDSKQQKQIWDSLSDTEKNLLSGTGYAPPKKSSESFFHQAVGAVGGVVASGLGTVADAVKSDVSGAAALLQGPINEAQHLYRSGAYLADRERQSGDSFLGTFTDPRTWSLSDYAKAWRDTQHGERTFLPTRVAQLTNQYGADTVNLAKQLAGGTSPDKLIQSQPDDASKQALATRLNTDKDLHDAVSQLQDAKISFGRRLVGQQLFQSHPALAHVISGAVDATADIAADPILMGAKVAKAGEMAPYIIGDGGRVGEILSKPGAEQVLNDTLDKAFSGDKAQRFLNVAGKALEQDGVGGATRKFSQLDPVGQQLYDAGVNDADSLKEWFKSKAGVAALLDGRVSGVATHDAPGVLVPSLTRRSALMLPVKAAAGDALDAIGASDLPIVKQTIGAVARAMDRISMLRVPVGEKVGADPTKDVTWIRRLAEYAMGGIDSDGNKITSQAVDDIVNKWVADPTYGTYKGLLSTTMDGMGVPQDFKDAYFSEIEGTKAVHSYGINDKLVIDGQPTATGFTENQVMDQGWTPPEFRELRLQAQGNLYGAINGNKADAFSAWWKPAQLLRLGFPIRTAGEELFASMLRDGPIPLLRARLAASSLNDGPFQPFHPVERALNLLTAHLPDSVAEKINTPRDLAGEVLGDRAHRWGRAVMAHAANLGSDVDYLNGAQIVRDKSKLVDAASRIADVVPNALPEEVSAVHLHGAGFLDTVDNAKQMLRDGTTGKPMHIQLGDTYRNFMPTENLYTRVWHNNLDEYANDRLMRAALGAADSGEEAQIQAVVDKLNEPGLKMVASKGERGKQTLDERVVGDGATKDEALRDWARVVVDNANHVTSDSAGNRIDDIFNAVNAGKTPDINILNSIPEELRPSTMNGRDMIPVSGPNRIKEMADNGFGRIGRMMNWISREPMFVHNMANSMDEVEKLRGLYVASLGGDGLNATPEHIDQQLSELAWGRALNKTIPYIHDPSVRSQFSEDARNLAPFQFAQEQFMKRWANTAAHSPEAFREAQLTMSGLRNIGFIHKDPQTGQEYFMYPGASVVQDLLTNTWGKLTGDNITLPIPVGFSGQVQFATPGTERLAAPSFGPLVAIPMRGLTRVFPELSQLEQQVVGPRGAGRSYWEDIAPASLTRVIHAVLDHPDDVGSQMHSATIQAIQSLEATGNGPADGANSQDITDWQQRVKSWARIIMWTRAIYGFSAPASPNVSFDPKNLNAEYSQLIGQMPLGDAFKEFMRRHPDATSYTVFQSKSVSGAPLPATQDAMDFMNQHEEFLKSYPQASAWFLPGAPKGQQTQFSMPAYREGLSLGLRQKKGVDEFYKDIKFAEAASTYFATRDARDKALADAHANGDSAEVGVINKQWSDFSDPYLAAHTMFRDQLMSADGQIRRQDTVDQLRQAMNDPNLPQSPQTKSIADMVATFDGLQNYLAPIKGLRTSAADAEKKAAKAQFATWAHGYVQQHPEVEGLYNSVFRLLVGDDAQATA